MLFFREICLERDVRLKGDTQEVHWSVQGFMEEIKISLAEFFFFFLFWDIVLRNYVYTTIFVSQFLNDQ